MRIEEITKTETILESVQKQQAWSKPMSISQTFAHIDKICGANDASVNKNM